jgi:uncharacterized protein
VANFPCPICNSPMPANWKEYPEFPFCTKRCKLIDLGRWLSEDYKLTDHKPDSQSSEGE